MGKFLFDAHPKVKCGALLLGLIALCGLFACDTDKAGAIEHPGLLQFGLQADTIGISGDVVVSKAGLPDLSEFLDTDMYTVEILQGEENNVIQVFDRYKDMPEEVELERGSYRIRASMGELKAASFESPRFEGLSDFLIKENMTTRIDVTCSLANARVAVVYTDSFKVVYPHYSLTLGSSHTTNATDSLRYVQDETRGGWFQVNETGETLNGVLTVKPDTGEVKQFAVKIPSVKPKDNVRLTFNSTPNTRPDQGLTVKITINNETIEKPIYMYVPDYMLPVDAALLEPHGFAHEDPIVLAKDDQVKEANVKMYVPGTIENCKLSIWQEGGQPTEYDLAHLKAADKVALNELGFQLPDIWRKKQVSLDFKPVIEKLPRIPQGETDVKRYNYQLIVTDSLVNPHVSKPLLLTVKMIPDVAPKVLLSDGFISSQAIQVTEGGLVYSDGVKRDPEYVATIESSIALSACILKTTDARGVAKQYDLKQGEVVPGVKYDLSASTPSVNFKEAILALVLDDDNIKRYEYELTVQTEQEGVVYEDVKTLIVDLLPPKFEITMNGDLDENGDAFAKRAVLRAQTKTGDPSKLIFQLFENGQWADIATTRTADTSIKEDEISVVLTGLTPETQYRVRAKYGKHISGEKTFTTEKADTYLPNSKMEEWSYYTVNNKYVYWKKWYPWKKDKKETRAWNTINLTTTQYAGTNPTYFLGFATSPYVGTSYVANSGAISTTVSVSGMAALIRTVGWGKENKADGSAPQKVNAGELFLGDYNESTYESVYGIDFHYRPTAFSFFYKYEPKNSSDYFIARIVVLDKENRVISSSELPSIEAIKTDSFSKKTVYVDYSGDNSIVKAAKMYILFKSGVENDAGKDNLNYPNFGNLSDGEFVGSKLYIDDVELIYE